MQDVRPFVPFHATCAGPYLIQDDISWTRCLKSVSTAQVMSCTISSSLPTAPFDLDCPRGWSIICQSSCRVISGSPRITREGSFHQTTKEPHLHFYITSYKKYLLWSKHNVEAAGTCWTRAHFSANFDINRSTWDNISDSQNVKISCSVKELKRYGINRLKLLANTNLDHLTVRPSS